jgi:hypothetical protein
MALLLDQIVEGVGGAQLTGMNQAHVQVTLLLAIWYRQRNARNILRA